MAQRATFSAVRFMVRKEIREVNQGLQFRDAGTGFQVQTGLYTWTCQEATAGVEG